MIEEGLLHESKNKINRKNIIIGAILIITLIGVFTGIALFQSSSANHFLRDHELEYAEFDTFLQKFSRVYKDSDEYQNRFAVFKANLDYIRINNNQQSSWKLALNEFADLTHEEFKSIYLTFEGNYEHEPTEKINRIELASYPSLVDWRISGKVGPVKYQGSCGACWAFSTTGSVESAYAIKNNILYSLSEQQLVDCSVSFGNQGCKQGWMSKAFQYVIKNGLVEETTYPYLGVTNKCNTSITANPVVKITSYVNGTQNSVAALATAVSNQPVSVAVDANNWQFYSSGIIGASFNCTTNLNHAVLIVGYNTINDYWIVKNQWGTHWGMQGYVYVGQVDGPGVCGIQKVPSYPII